MIDIKPRIIPAGYVNNVKKLEIFEILGTDLRTEEVLVPREKLSKLSIVFYAIA